MRRLRNRSTCSGRAATNLIARAVALRRSKRCVRSSGSTDSPAHAADCPARACNPSTRAHDTADSRTGRRVASASTYSPSTYNPSTCWPIGADRCAAGSEPSGDRCRVSPSGLRRRSMVTVGSGRGPARRPSHLGNRRSPRPWRQLVHLRLRPGNRGHDTGRRCRRLP